MNNFLLRAIFPQLLEYVHTINFQGNSCGTVELENIIKWGDMLPSNHFLALIGGEYLPRWQHRIFCLLKNQEIESAAMFYIRFRQTLPYWILENDLMLDILTATLDIMRKAHRQENISDFSPNYKSYKDVLKSLTIDNETLMNFQSMKRSSTTVESHNVTATFKDVVQSVAEEHGICFAPRQGRFYEGKQLWEFGSVNIYIENDVAYWSHTSASFKPVTIDELLQITLGNQE